MAHKSNKSQDDIASSIPEFHFHWRYSQDSLDFEETEKRQQKLAT